MSTLALVRTTVPGHTHKFYEPRVPPRNWRGLTISTPYFAAADIDSTQISKLAKLGTTPKTKYWRNMKTQTFSPRGMLDALRFYGISGWSSNLADK